MEKISQLILYQLLVSNYTKMQEIINNKHDIFLFSFDDIDFNGALSRFKFDGTNDSSKREFCLSFTLFAIYALDFTI